MTKPGPNCYCHDEIVSALIQTHKFHYTVRFHSYPSPSEREGEGAHAKLNAFLLVCFYWYENILSDKNTERKGKTEERPSGRYLGRE
jgi:hypothetical protein